MKKILELITEEFEKAFEQNEYDKKLGKVVVSNRPDLCQYQRNGAMAGAKLYHKAPIMIANQVVESLQDNEMFESVEAVMPGFINIKLNSEFVAKYLNDMKEADKYGCENKAPETIVIDYGGASLYMLDICVQQLLVKVLNVLKDLWVIKLFLTFIWETGDFRWDLLSQNLNVVNLI